MLHINQCSRHLESQLKELYVIFASDKYHKNVFPGVPIIGFKNSKKLKSYLVRAVLPDINEEEIFGLRDGKRPPCQLWSHMKNTNIFKSKHSNLSNKQKLWL